MSSVWVVIAAFNEGRTIRTVVESLAAYNVVVVDDGSTDSTPRELAGTHAHVLRHMVNQGQGAALQTGITYALKEGAQFLVTFDADGQHSAADIPRMVQPLTTGEHEVALGTRFAGAGQAVGIPPTRKLLLKAALLVTRELTHLNVTDTHNGFSAFTAGAAAKMRITQNRMTHASQLLHQIRAHRLRYTEVPVTVVYSAETLEKGQKMSNSLNILWESLMGLLRR
jgi:glycosyltransferase involved in cell wall biosynthesis